MTELHVMTDATNVTNGTNVTDVAKTIYPNPFDTPHIRTAFIILFSTVFVVCIIGNILVIVVILKHRRMRTTTNFFLANLAVADLCVGVFCVIPNLSLNLSPYWKLGKVMCKLQFFVQAMSYTASVIILTAISVERYVAIIYPVRSKHLVTICLLRYTVVMVWLIAAACGAPYLFLFESVEVKMVDNSTTHFCLNVADRYDARAHSTMNLALLYLLPLTAMTFIYSRIAVVLWRTSRLDGRNAGGAYPGRAPLRGRRDLDSMPSDELSVGGSDETSHCMNSEGREGRWRRGHPDVVCVTPASPRSPGYKSCAKATLAPEQAGGNCKSQIKRLLVISQRIKSRGADNALLARRRVIRLLIAVVASFTACMAPYHARQMWQAWGDTHVSFSTALIPPTTLVIYYLNSALNPILYAFLSNNFRKSLSEIMSCRSGVEGRRAAVVVSGTGRTGNTAV